MFGFSLIMHVRKRTHRKTWPSILFSQLTAAIWMNYRFVSSVESPLSCNNNYQHLQELNYKQATVGQRNFSSHAARTRLLDGMHTMVHFANNRDLNIRTMEFHRDALHRDSYPFTCLAKVRNAKKNSHFLFTSPASQYTHFPSVI